MVSTLKVAGTGHRPHKLNKEYDLRGPLTKAIVIEVYKFFDLLSPSEIISGMALGFDQIIAICAIRRGLPVTAAIPCEGQGKNVARNISETLQKDT
jgi:hypothetical protein